MSYVNILQAFLGRSKMCTLVFGLRKTVCISHFCPMSSQILSYINIFDINRRLLAQAMDVKYVVSNLGHYKSDLDHLGSHHIHFKNHLSQHKGDRSHKQTVLVH